MPYRMQRAHGGWLVVNTQTGKQHSTKPLPRTRAQAQMRALYAAEQDTTKAAADVSTGEARQSGAAGGSGSGFRAGAGGQIRGNLFRGSGGQFQAGPGGQLRQRLEAIREMRKQAKAKKGKAKAKGKAAPKPKPTDEEKDAAKLQQQADNRAKVFGALDIPEDAAGSLEDLAAGKPVDDDGGLVAMGLAEVGKDGTIRLTSTGRAVYQAASRGEAGATRDALGRGRDQAAGRSERETARAEREAKRNERAAEREKKKAKAGGGGGKGKKEKPPAEKPTPEQEAAAKEETRTKNREAIIGQMMKNDAGITSHGFEALTELSTRGEMDEAVAEGLESMGLVDRDSKGTPRVSAQGRRLIRAVDKGDYDGALEAIATAQDRANTRKQRAGEKADKDAERTRQKQERNKERARQKEERDAKQTERKERITDRALRQLERGGRVSDGQLLDMEDEGLVTFDDDDKPVLTEKGRKRLQARKKDTDRVDTADRLPKDDDPARGRGTIPPRKQRDVFVATKHMPGGHDQRAHGRATARRSGMRAAYQEARAGGATPAEARAESNNVSTIYRQQQRMSNIIRQGEGEISEKQRASLNAEYERLKTDTMERVARVRNVDQSNELHNQILEPTVRGRYGALHDYDRRLSVSRARHQETLGRIESARRDLRYKEEAAVSARNASTSIRRQYEKERNEARRELQFWEKQKREYERDIRRNERLYEQELARPEMRQRRIEIMGERAYHQAYREGKPHHEAVTARERARQGASTKK